jgi:DNA invertase Pin-like site-specific DNA recombinase
MATKAGIWLRVSTGGQDEANQLPDVERYCLEREYVVGERYELNDRSAFKGEQDKTLAVMLHDMRTRKIEVLVCWRSDRVERRGPEAMFRLLRGIKEAGGRIESVTEPMLAKTDLAGTATTALTAVLNYQESAKKSDSVRLAVERNRNDKAWWGNSHWGYAIVGEKRGKTLAPTADGIEYVEAIFKRIADGESCHQVGEWLRSGPRPGVSDKTVYRMIRNPVYRGVKTVNSRAVMEVPALVDDALWKAANDRLSNAPRGRRGPANGQSAFLTSVLFCGSCRKPDGKAAPMYRIHPRGNYFYYRCRGHAPELKGCGNMARVEVLDNIVTALLSMAHEPYTELRRVKGENYDADLARIQLALNDLPKQGLSRQDEQTERERLWAEEDRYTELNKHARPDYWDDVPTGEAVGEHFTSLDFGGRRKMMLDDDVKIYAEKTPDKIAALGLLAPIVSIESRLFKLPLVWRNEPDLNAEDLKVYSSGVAAIRPRKRP